MSLGLTSDAASIQYELWITCYDADLQTQRISVDVSSPQFTVFGFFRLRICAERSRHPGLSVNLKVADVSRLHVNIISKKEACFQSRRQKSSLGCLYDC